jgi:hypothetical protein
VTGVPSWNIAGAQREAPGQPIVDAAGRGQRRLRQAAVSAPTRVSAICSREE